jgi:tetratricopeptide (TPR) repeat protein
MKRLVLFAVLTIAASAHASVWDHALENDSQKAADEAYEKGLAEGDNETMIALSYSSGLKTILDATSRAEAAYRAAAAARPDKAEPYYRIGTLLYAMHFQCEPAPQLAIVSPPAATSLCEPHYATRERAQAIVDAWDNFEKRAPLDPRLNEILMRRALTRTKLISGAPGDKKSLEAVIRDYNAVLDHGDGLTGLRDESVLGNLAETYMMLGNLDDAIDTYRAAVAGGAQTATVYGLAVALDRDGRSDEAIRLIRAQRSEGRDQFVRAFQTKQIFFVPAGEENYYFALSSEAFGDETSAAEFWNRYLASGAHPQYQPRAREHLATLKKPHARQAPDDEGLEGISQ